jgi:hypothetical protein
MAKKTKKPNKASKAKASKPKARKSPKIKKVDKVQTLRTPFMKEFTETFIKGPGKQWPADGAAHLLVAGELNDICSVLFRAALTQTTPTEASSDGTLRGDVALKLAQLGWPQNGDVDRLVTSRKVRKKTLRITEALVILERLAQAASDHTLPGDGGGGDSTKIPPH